MLYYFNLTNGRETILDHQGVEVLCLNAALIQARETIEELRDENLSSSYVWKGWWLEIVDGAGLVVEILPLDESLNRVTRRCVRSRPQDS